MLLSILENAARWKSQAETQADAARKLKAEKKNERTPVATETDI